MQERVTIVEEKVAEPSPKEHTDYQRDDEVRNLAGRQRGAPGAAIAHHQPAAGDESKDVGQPIPADSHISPEADDKRTEVVDPVGERQEDLHREFESSAAIRTAGNHEWTQICSMRPTGDHGNGGTTIL